MIANMNITGVQQQPTTAMAAKQSNQDSHEINIQKQIVTLQEKMRGITYDSKMSAEEKDNEKKALQEKIQNLNSELKQYQLQKRQEEAEKRQKEAARQKEMEERQMTESSSDTKENSAAGISSENISESGGNNNMTEQESGQAESDAMLSMAGTKEHLADMQKIRAKLENQMRTAPTAQEKAKLQKKIDAISKKMGEKMQKISDTIEDTQKEDKARKAKVKKLLQEFRDKRKNMSAAVSKTTDTAQTGGYWQDRAAMPGKVLLTRKKS
ncbi:MAG: FlxA-like family protein [Bacillus sp. (in: Bacteria)]|nr:FlxA-like family protein [Bacillus sp. (in: firmicutes)]MCM1425779.1 FlxA-like family protein [Eubacterium sp.]